MINKSLVMAAALALGGAVGSYAQAAEIKPVLLKTPVAFNTALPGLGTTIRWVGERLETASNGSLKMTVYEPNRLVAPFEILDAVSSGKVNSGFATATYWAGKLPAAPLFSAVPFGPEAGEFLAWLWYGNGMALYQEMYDKSGYDVKVFVCGILPPESSGWFSSEINNHNDLKGLKMRFFGPGGQVMQKLGVSTSLLPSGEIFSALEKNAIDAAEFSIPAIDRRLGFYKLAKYNYFPGWHQQTSTLELLVNKEVYAGMHESQRLFLDTVCKAAVANSFAEGEALQFEAMHDNVKKDGVKIRYWSDEMLDLFHRAWNEVAREQAAKDAFFRKVWDDLSGFRARYGIWKANAFLPRPERQ